MESPKCKICGQRHYGVCASKPSLSALRAMATQVAAIPPDPIPAPPIEAPPDPPIEVPVEPPVPIDPPPQLPIEHPIESPMHDAWDALLCAVRSGEFLSMPMGQADKLVYEAMGSDAAQRTIARMVGLYIAHGRRLGPDRRASHAAYMKDWRAKRKEQQG